MGSSGTGAARSAEAASGAARQERLLSEITHELGNYFHKLYYWAELVREQRPSPADAEPALLLEGTIRELEGFLKRALDYFRPISVATVDMGVTEVADSVRGVLTRHAEPAPVTWHGTVAPGGTVAIDPGRFSFVLEGLVRRIRAGGAPAVSAGVETDGAGLVITVAARAAERGADTVGAALEWAILERIVEAHGGDVIAVAEPAGHRVRLRVPIAS